MQFIIYLNRCNIMNTIDATLINNQNVFNALLKNFAQIKTKSNIKMNNIKKLYKLKEKILSIIKS